MTATDTVETESFAPPLPSRHDESHPSLFARAPDQLPTYSDFEDPAERLTVCEVPRKVRT